MSANANWIVEKARSYLKDGDSCAAKSWLLTAKTLFPDASSVQYEELQMERKAGKVERCGKLFYDMICTFPKEEMLWEELAKIFHAQDPTRVHNAETTFLKNMFDSLGDGQQRELLLKYANHQQDLVEKCRISLLVLKRFKGAVRDQGIKLITTLKEAEDRECSGKALNIYRKMIVCDVLPLILKSSDTHVSENPRKSPKSKKSHALYVTEDQMMYFLNLSMEFYISYAIHKGSLDEVTQTCPSLSPELSSLDLDETFSSWHMLHELLVTFASKLGWNNLLKFKDKIDPAKSRTLRSRYKTLYNARDTKPALAIFYSVLHLYLYTAIEYCSAVNSSSSGGGSGHCGAESNEFILVECIEQMSQKESVHQSVIRAPKKRKRNDSGSCSSDNYQSSSEEVTVIVNPGLIGHVNDSIGESLQVAIDCRNFLQGFFETEFALICHEWGVEKWAWLQMFDIDACLFQGKYLEVIDILEGLHTRELKAKSHHVFTLKQSLQLASSLFCVGAHRQACQKVLQAISLVNAASLSSPDTHKDDRSTKPEGRNLLVLSSSSNEVLTYVCQIVFAALKARLHSNACDQDTVIGHLIILCQLHWQKNEEFFEMLLKLIKSKRKFIYPLFFYYVINIDILEEFAHLHSSNFMQLELMPTEDLSSKTVTRGVNKGVKDDFKSALDRQVQRCYEPIKSILFSFLSDEKDSILKPIAASTPT